MKKEQIMPSEDIMDNLTDLFDKVREDILETGRKERLIELMCKRDKHYHPSKELNNINMLITIYTNIEVFE
jgi:hypothetical protein